MVVAAVEIADHRPGDVVSALAPFLSEARKAKIETVIASRVADVHVAIEAPTDPHNAAAVVRTAEAFGLLNVHVIGAEGRALEKKKTTQGAYHWVHTREHESLADFFGAVADVRVCGAWLDAPVALEDLDAQGPMCLLFGNENRGLSAQARAACTVGFSIPMAGMSESLNLSVSAAVSLYSVMRRRPAGGDLDEGARARLRAAYYARCVDPRHLDAVIGGAA